MPKQVLETKVGAVYKQMKRKPIIIRKQTPIQELVARIVNNPLSRSLCVVDENQKLIGLVTPEQLMDVSHMHFGRLSMMSELRIKKKTEILRARMAKDIMISPVTATFDDTLEKAIETMVACHIEEIPVVDENLKIKGCLNCLEILQKLWEKR